MKHIYDKYGILITDEGDCIKVTLNEYVANAECTIDKSQHPRNLNSYQPLLYPLICFLLGLNIVKILLGVVTSAQFTDYMTRSAAKIQGFSARNTFSLYNRIN